MTYSDLSTTLQTWATRSYSDTQVREFVRLAEASINRKLGPQYRREMAETITTDASGEAALPGDFLEMRSLTRSVTGSVPLLSTSWAGLVSINPYGLSGTPSHFAIQGSKLKVAPVYEGDFAAVYRAGLPPLGDNDSNWLLDIAPDVYLFACRAAQAAFEEEFDKAALFEAKAVEGIDELIRQSTVAQFSRGGVVLSGVTP